MMITLEDKDRKEEKDKDEEVVVKPARRRDDPTFPTPPKSMLITFDKKPDRHQDTTPTRPVADPPPQPEKREDTGERRRETDSR